jgi:L-fuconolactonase
MTIIDAHQHVWDPTRARYDWLTAELAPINRPIGFDELRPALREAGVDATVLVQSADNDDDTNLMLRTAETNPEIAAIVAYVPLERPAIAAERLAELRRNPRVVGIRNLIHEIPDPDWLLRPDVDEGLGVLEDAGVTFDLVAVLPRYLEHVPTLSERHPRLKIVIDHLSKPPIGLDDREPWWSLIRRAAENPLVHAKVSGLYSATADSSSWTVDAVRPFVARALDVFGADRLMYGGDWPISVLSGGYQRVWEGLLAFFAELDSEERRRILGETAKRFYGIDETALEAAHAASRNMTNDREGNR